MFSPPAYDEPVKPVFDEEEAADLYIKKDGYSRRPGFWIMLFLVLLNIAVFYYGFTMTPTESLELTEVLSSPDAEPIVFSFWPAKIAFCLSSLVGMAVLLMMPLDPELTLTNKYYTRLYVPITLFFACFITGVGCRFELKEYISSFKTNLHIIQARIPDPYEIHKDTGIIIIKYAVFGLVFGLIGAWIVLLVWTMPEDYDNFGGFLRCFKPYKPKEVSLK